MKAIRLLSVMPWISQISDLDRPQLRRGTQIVAQIVEGCRRAYIVVPQRCDFEASGTPNGLRLAFGASFAASRIKTMNVPYHHQALGATARDNGHAGGGDSSYDACFEGLLRSGSIGGVALLDAARGQPLYERRVDDRLPRPPPSPPLPPPPCAAEDADGQRDERKGRGGDLGRGDGRRCYGLVSPSEGRQLVTAVKGLTEDGLCRQERLTCAGTPFRVFGGTPLGLYAMGPRRRVGLIVRALPRVGFLVVLYRWPHLPQQVVGEVDDFVEQFWTHAQDVRLRLPPPP